MFTRTPCDLRFHAGGRAELLLPLTWRTSTGVLIVPAGFRTDGASIPAVLWWLVGHPFSFSLLRAATLHDYELVIGASPAAVIHRRFYAALRATGNGRVRSGVCFLGAWLGEIRRHVRRIGCNVPTM